MRAVQLLEALGRGNPMVVAESGKSLIVFPGAVKAKMDQVDADIEAFTKDVDASTDQVFQASYYPWRDSWKKWKADNEGDWNLFWNTVLVSDQVLEWEERLKGWRASFASRNPKTQPVSPQPVAPVEKPDPNLQSIEGTVKGAAVLAGLVAAMVFLGGRR